MVETGETGEIIALAVHARLYMINMLFCTEIRLEILLLNWVFHYLCKAIESHM